MEQKPTYLDKRLLLGNRLVVLALARSETYGLCNSVWRRGNKSDRGPDANRHRGALEVI